MANSAPPRKKLFKKQGGNKTEHENGKPKFSPILRIWPIFPCFLAIQESFSQCVGKIFKNVGDFLIPKTGKNEHSQEERNNIYLC